jgi:TonB family protein
MDSLRIARLLAIVGPLVLGCAGSRHRSADDPSAKHHPSSERIQQIIRNRYWAFRYCYEVGLARNPDLEGKVVVRFTIEPNGSVANVELVGSTMPDHETVACIVKGYKKLKFPRPRGGAVTVVYPIMFSP